MTIGEVNGTSVHYELNGSGPPVVLVPGLGGTTSMWEPQVEHFSRTHQVLTFDPRGAGRSGRLTGWRHILRRQTADLAALLDRLDLDRVVLCGVSFGGVFAQRFALDHPDRCAGLVIVDSFSDTVPHSLRELGLIAAANLSVPMWLLPPGAILPGIRRQYQRWPHALGPMERLVRELRRYETAKIRAAINWVNFTPQLSRVDCRLLGIVGGTSPDLLAWMRRLTGAVPGARLEVVPDSFDPTNLCRPEEFNRLLADFLTEIDWTPSPPP